MRSVGGWSLVVPLALLLLTGCPAAESPSPETVLRVEQDGLLYAFHMLTGTESLFDLEHDPRCLRNLAPWRPADVARLRNELERRRGIENLDVWRKLQVSEPRYLPSGEVVR